MKTETRITLGAVRPLVLAGVGLALAFAGTLNLAWAGQTA